MRFPLWENEQLACVRDYLFDQISVPYDDALAHCVEWAAHKPDEICYDDGWRSPHNINKEGLLSRGLGFIRRLASTTTFSDRCKLSESDSNPDFLFPALSAHDFSFNSLGYHMNLSECNPDKRAYILDAPTTSDTDLGPRKAWLWAHTDSPLYELYNAQGRGHRFLRQRGYVMWDPARWERWGLLDEEWDEEPPEEYDPERLEEQAYEEEGKEMFRSMQFRRRICWAGGREWYKMGDESRVEWPGGKAPEGWLEKGGGGGGK